MHWAVRGRGKSTVIPLKMLLEIPEEAFKKAMADRKHVVQGTNNLVFTSSDRVPRLSIGYASPNVAMTEFDIRCYYAQNWALPMEDRKRTLFVPSLEAARTLVREAAEQDKWHDRFWWKVWRLLNGIR
jgi:hypothetical protein